MRRHVFKRSDKKKQKLKGISRTRSCSKTLPSIIFIFLSFTYTMQIWNFNKLEKYYPPKRLFQSIMTEYAPNHVKSKEDHIQSTSLRQHTHFDPSITAAMQFVSDRREAYENQNKIKRETWSHRGIGYLYENHGVVLMGKQPPKLEIGLNTIRIYNVNRPVDCSKIFIWARVNGPEIFAGQAVHTSSQKGNCHWKFEFDIRKQGAYSVEAKVLLWDPEAATLPITPATSEECGETKDSSITSAFPIHQEYLGFKLYHPTTMCCEICSRLNGHCKAWAYIDRSLFARGCELYFSNETDYDIPVAQMMSILKKTTTKFHDNMTQLIEPASPTIYGVPHKLPTSYFLGCSWSFWLTSEFPCLSGDLDDRVFFENNETISLADDDHLQSNGKPTTSLFEENNNSIEDRRPLCAIDQESFEKHKGRWVREQFPNASTCPIPMEYDHGFQEQKVAIIKHDGERPHCWHRDDFSEIGKKFVEHSFRYVDVPPESKWISPLHKEKEWFGHWKHDDCRYLEFTDVELQQCVDRRKLYGFQVTGKSISTMLVNYVNQRLKNIRLYDHKTHGDGIEVILSTFALPHYCTYGEFKPSLQKAFSKAGLKYADEKIRYLYNSILQNVTANQEYFWTSGYFLSSERELMCTAPKMKRFSLIGEELLNPKGYKMINAYDMSAALTYDTAAQDDGLHIIGPTMKMITTKLFHFLCAQ